MTTTFNGPAGWNAACNALLDICDHWDELGCGRTDSRAVRDAVAAINNGWECTTAQHTAEACLAHRPPHVQHTESNERIFDFDPFDGSPVSFTPPGDIGEVFAPMRGDGI